jgi:hypothetical protein
LKIPPSHGKVDSEVIAEEDGRGITNIKVAYRARNDNKITHKI